jgi:hypothetical protein
MKGEEIMHRLKTFSIAALVIGQAAVPAQTQSAPAKTAKISADQVSFYTVPLACPAARGLGCGSAAKPVLPALEKKRSIQEAWLDHAGTMLAIVWKKGARTEVRSAEIQSVTNDRGVALHELLGERRDNTLKSFASRKKWYCGAEVDPLSEEEAGVIVDRLVRRAMMKEPTIGGKAESLKPAITKVIRDQLTGCTSTQCREDCHKRLTEIARQNLNDREFRALMEAEKQGYRPWAPSNEKPGWLHYPSTSPYRASFLRRAIAWLPEPTG